MEKEKAKSAEELVKKVMNIYLNGGGHGVPSIVHSDVTNSSGTDIIMLRDDNRNILAHYQHIEDDSFFEIGDDIS